MTKNKELVRHLAEQMAKEHNEGIGVIQTGEINVEWWLKHARIAVKLGAKMFEEGYRQGAKDFGYKVDEYDPDVKIEQEKRGLIAEKEGDHE